MANASLDRSPKLDRLKILATIAIFSVGLSVYLAANYLDGFVKVVLQGVGGLIAVAIGVEFVYSTFLEEVHRRRTLDEIDSRLDDVLERALTQSSLREEMQSLSCGLKLLTDQLDDKLQKAVQATFRSEIERVVVGGSLYGFAGFVERLRFETLFQSLQEGDELMWLDTYCAEHPRFEQPLREAVRRGATIRMLAIDPKSNLIPLRALEIDEDLEVNYTPKQFIEGATRSLHCIIGCVDALIRDDPRGSIAVRTYTDLPCIPMYLIARGGKLSEAYTSFFLNRPTYREPHIRWTEAPESRLGSFHAYFERKWIQHSGAEVAVAGSTRSS